MTEAEIERAMLDRANAIARRSPPVDWLEQARLAFVRRYHDDLQDCYRSGQMSERQWQEHKRRGDV